MRSSPLRPHRFRLLFLGVVCAAASVIAQADRGKARIRSLDTNYVRSPKYQDSGNAEPRAAQRTTEWLQVRLEYETSGGRDGWIDEITIDWYVVIVPGSGKPILCRRSIAYVDIPDGSHHAVAYMRPGFMQRYAGGKRVDRNSLSAYVEIKIKGGGTVSTEFGKAKTPKNWWTYDEPTVTVKTTELLTRLETPFAPMNWEFYEHIKVEPPR